MDVVANAGTRTALSRDEALEIAKSFVPVFEQRSEQCMKGRRVCDDTIRDLKTSGLIRLMQPKRFGGHELGRDVLCEVIRLFAPACGSQAWVYHVLADHAWMLGTFPKQAQEDIWGKDIDTLISSSFAPVGKAVPVDAGFLCSGRHGFSSGIDHVEWVACGAIDQVSQEVIHVLVRKSEGEVIDDWNVNGLEGTGSKSFRVNEVFVPRHRTIVFSQALEGRAPGTMVNTAPLYRVPRFGYTSAGFAALAVGMARSLLSQWLVHTVRRGGGLKKGKRADSGGAMRCRDRCCGNALSDNNARRHASIECRRGYCR